jgi:hypothetical protein
LHDVIQAAMPFEDCHLFRFDVGGKRYGIPNPEWDDDLHVLDAKNIRFGAPIDRGVSQFAYVYDFGDHWLHAVTVEATLAVDPALTYPGFLDGARRAPPDDVGGIPGFEDFVDIMADPRHHEHGRLIEWHGFLRFTQSLPVCASDDAR